MEGPKARNHQARRNPKKSKGRNNAPCEVDGICEENCDTKSYRIYANPKGDGYAVEERFRKAGDDTIAGKKTIIVMNGSSNTELVDGIKFKKQIKTKGGQKAIKRKERIT